MKQKGFTLVELLIVVAIIGILSAIAIPQFVKYKRNAAVASCNSDLRNCINMIAANFAEGNVTKADGTNATVTGGVANDAGCFIPGNEFGPDGSADWKNRKFLVYEINGSIDLADSDKITGTSNPKWGNNIQLTVDAKGTVGNCTLSN